MSPEAQRDMINAAVRQAEAEIMSKAPKPVLTPEQQCLARANTHILAARQKFIAQFRLMPMRPSYEQAVEMIYPLLRAELASWSKDDFATLACMAIAITAAESLRDELA
jgi:hypothetical protein